MSNAIPPPTRAVPIPPDTSKDLAAHAKKSIVATFAHSLVKTGVIAGGAYIVRGYVRNRLDDVRLKMEAEQRSKDILRSRFLLTQEDTSYTVLALLPTLATQVMSQMDLDALTSELQARSKSKAAALIPSSVIPNQAQAQSHQVQTQHHSATPSSSLASSIVDLDPNGNSANPPADLTTSAYFTSGTHFEDLSQPDSDTRSDVESVSSSAGASTSASASVISITDGGSGSVTRSWVQTSASESNLERPISPSRSISHDGERDPVLESIHSSATTSSTSESDSHSQDTNSSEKRTKAELWNEVKMLAFTRTLTTLYSTTLLCLLTSLQLSLLARSRYVSFVLHLEKEEQTKETFQREMQEMNIGLGGMLMKSLMSQAGRQFNKLVWGEEKDFKLDFGQLFEEDDEQCHRTEEEWRFLEAGTRRGVWLGKVSEEVENKYLTMSWWLLHVGWKDVGERVRRGVEEVFDGVSLKTKLSSVDFHRLISDVRRRVEVEITFEGTEKRTNFLSSLLPPTPETVHHVLTQGGYTPSSSLIETQDVSPNSYRNKRRPHSESSTSFESSQISKNFVDSPAVGISHLLSPGDLPSASAPLISHPPLPVEPQQTVFPPPPPTYYTHVYDAPFVALLSETRNILSSPDFVRVLEVCLDVATSVLCSGIERNVFGKSHNPEEEEKQKPGSSSKNETKSEERIRLAGLLPGLARWSQLALEGLPNELIDNVLNTREVSCLSAIAFSKFEEQFC